MISRKSQRVKFFFSSCFSYLIIASILAGCGISFQQNDSDWEYQVVNTPVGEYRSVAWVTDDLIAFNYGAFAYGSTRAEDWEESLIAFHKVGTDGWSDSRQIPKPEECQVGDVSHLMRLATDQLGFMYSCHKNGPSGILYNWNIQEDTIVQLYDYPKSFFVTSYSTNPAISEESVAKERGGGGKVTRRVTFLWPKSLLGHEKGCKEPFRTDFEPNFGTTDNMQCAAGTLHPGTAG
jgi:hypothetical protein